MIEPTLYLCELVAVPSRRVKSRGNWRRSWKRPSRRRWGTRRGNRPCNPRRRRRGHRRGWRRSPSWEAILREGTLRLRGVGWNRGSFGPWRGWATRRACGWPRWRRCCGTRRRTRSASPDPTDPLNPDGFGPKKWNKAKWIMVLVLGIC